MAASRLMMKVRVRHRLKATERDLAFVAPASAAVPLPALACAPALAAG